MILSGISEINLRNSPENKVKQKRSLKTNIKKHKPKAECKIKTRWDADWLSRYSASVAWKSDWAVGFWMRTEWTIIKSKGAISEKTTVEPTMRAWDDRGAERRYDHLVNEESSTVFELRQGKEKRFLILLIFQKNSKTMMFK